MSQHVSYLLNPFKSCHLDECFFPISFTQNVNFVTISLYFGIKLVKNLQICHKNIYFFTFFISMRCNHFLNFVHRAIVLVESHTFCRRFYYKQAVLSTPTFLPLFFPSGRKLRSKAWDIIFLGMQKKCPDVPNSSA